MISENNHGQYVYRVSPDQIATHIPVTKADKAVIRMYKDVFRRPMIAVLHAMIGQSAKCWEEKHEEVIQNLEERARTQARIIVRFYHIDKLPVED